MRRRTTTSKVSLATTSLPSDLSSALLFGASIGLQRSLRKYQRRTRNVTPMESTEGIRKYPSHCPKAGILEWNTTRLAGLEIGRTKEAALAIKAQAKRNGNG